MKSFPSSVKTKGIFGTIIVGLALALPTLSYAGHHEADETTSSFDPRTPQQVCAQMIEAWYGGDGEKMAGVLHENLAKRGVLENSETNQAFVMLHSKEDLVAGASQGVGILPPGEWDITIETLDVMETMAIVKVTSAKLIDICQLAKLESGWQVVNVLWVVR